MSTCCSALSLSFVCDSLVALSSSRLLVYSQYVENLVVLVKSNNFCWSVDNKDYLSVESIAYN